jgi:choline dehydrogenase
MQYGTSLDWTYKTEPESGCADRRIAQLRGRVLGGCSAMNGMFWVKGSDLDYDGWRLPGWGWDEVAPVFARIEQGPMHITRSPNPRSCPDIRRWKSDHSVAEAQPSGPGVEDDTPDEVGPHMVEPIA